MSSLKQRLLSAEDEFISALADGDDALVAFADKWERLLEEADVAFHDHCPDSDMGALVYTTSIRIATLAESSSELYARHESFAAQLTDQLEALMSDLAIFDSSPLSQIPTTLPPCTTSIKSKRRRTSSPERELTYEPTKRRRVIADPPSCGEDRKSSPSGDSYTSPATFYPPSPSLPRDTVPSRKRRCSDSEPTSDAPPHKRRYVGPRLHAVSDSFVASRFVGASGQGITRPLSSNNPNPDQRPIIQPLHMSSGQQSLGSSSPDCAEIERYEPPRLDVCNVLPDLDPATLPLPGLDSLDAFLETIFQTHDSIIPHPPLPRCDTPYSPSHFLQKGPASGAVHHSSDSSTSASDSDTGSSPASSTPSSPRSFPATPLLDADILKFDLGSSQCFPTDDEWLLRTEFQLDSFYDAPPTLPETKWPFSSVGSSWIDVSRLIRPSLDEEFESLL
ncbi:A mating type homeodomain transcription factor [Trametes sanguinea]|nr:A mating type homeodomain transcription factor [Trametes sanguinea]